MTAIPHELPEAEAGYRRGVVLVLFSGVCWSAMGIFIRLMEVASAWQILFYRSIALSVLLLVVLAWRTGGRPDQAIRRAGLYGVLGGLGLVVAFSGGVYAVVHTSVANAVFLFASSPFLVALASRLVLGESVRRATWIAMVFAGAGMVLMVGEGIALGRAAGNIAALLSAAGFAAFTLAIRRGRSGDMLPAVCLGGLFATVFTGGVCLWLGEGVVVPVGDMALAAGLGLALGIGLQLYTIGSKAVPAAELALLSMSEVVLAPFWVWIFLDETVNPLILLGGAVLLAAIGGNALSGLRRRPPPLGAV